MSENGFGRIIGLAFEPMLSTLQFERQPDRISGRLYLAEFDSERHKVAIAFEPGDDALFVYIFGKRDDAWTDIDDRAQTPRLEDLGRIYRDVIPRSTWAAARDRLASIACDDDLEVRMIKAAAALSVTLPLYMADAVKHG